MNRKSKALVEVMVASALLAANAVVIALISLSSELILFLRGIFSVLSLLLILLFLKEKLSLDSKREYLSVLLLGFIFGLHWLTFFYAIKLSTVAVAMIATFTFPVMTTFLEPYFFGARLALKDVFVAFAVLLGIFIIVPEFSFDDTAFIGIVLGLSSAFFYSLRNIFSKKLFAHKSNLLIMLYQLFVVMLMFMPFGFLYEWDWNPAVDIWYIVWLSVMGTAIGHTLLLKSMNYLSARFVGVITSSQVVFGVIMAFLVLGQVPELNELIGGLIIIGVAVFEAVRHSEKTLLD